MEYTTISEIIRTSKELDTSFTIPKKRKLSADESPPKEAKKHEPESILNEAYGSSATPTSLWPQSTQNCNPFSTSPQAAHLKPATPTKEVPKNYKKSYRDSFQDVYDDTLPKELKEQFQPLFCKLCSATLGSTVNAKVHYGSKNHEKKVRRFLVEYAERTGEPLHKRAHVNSAKKDDEQYNPRHYHCDVCDLPLTGKAHAESHYMGKNHQKVLSGKKTPAGKGYYNDEGKYVRILSTPSDPSGRDSFGMDFAPKEQTVSTIPKATSLRCELCQVSVTSLPQMDIHLQGQKHQKKMRASGMAMSPDVTNADPNGPSSTQGNMYTSYRTPSGQYYCKVCDISLNSELQFSTHLQSRNHAKKSIVVKE